ncbi:hypothetical protein Scep_016950 [Stephania cephalantha]|uniref:Uncharacterized protein n=1 Tax=Stephania cephalantha TaxID=152367 RepID=A0AAP0INS5_9MAGN
MRMSESRVEMIIGEKRIRGEFGEPKHEHGCARRSSSRGESAWLAGDARARAAGAAASQGGGWCGRRLADEVTRQAVEDRQQRDGGGMLVAGDAARTSSWPAAAAIARMAAAATAAADLAGSGGGSGDSGRGSDDSGSDGVGADSDDGERRRGCDATNGAVARCRPVGCAMIREIATTRWRAGRQGPRPKPEVLHGRPSISR